MTDKAKPLPLPIPPTRSLTPPARRASGTWDLDADTPPHNPTVAEFGGLASVFDLLTHEERLEFTELGHYWHDLPAEFRAKVLKAVRMCPRKA